MTLTADSPLQRHGARRCMIAITGGIGSGKSVVSAVLRAIGYEVVDCDTVARGIMDTDPAIHARLCTEIDERAVVDGVVNRRRISRIVFADADKLARLNAIVHAAVRRVIEQRAVDTCAAPLFFETAILYASGFDALADAVWQVTAPIDVRVRRVVKRSALTADEVMARIRAQSAEESAGELAAGKVSIIVNDDTAAILPQLLELLRRQGLLRES